MRTCHDDSSHNFRSVKSSTVKRAVHFLVGVRRGKKKKRERQWATRTLIGGDKDAYYWLWQWFHTDIHIRTKVYFICKFYFNKGKKSMSQTEKVETEVESK